METEWLMFMGHQLLYTKDWRVTGEKMKSPSEMTRGVCQPSPHLRSRNLNTVKPFVKVLREKSPRN